MPVASMIDAGTAVFASGSSRISLAASLMSEKSSFLPWAVRMPRLSVASAPDAVVAMAAIGSFGALSAGTTRSAGGVNRLA